MSTKFRALQQTVSRDCVTAFCHFQFSGSSGAMPNFSGAGFQGCYLSGTTYTLVADAPYPQLLGVHFQLALDKTYLGTISGALDIMPNGAQLNQFRTQTTGSVQGTGSGNPQSLDFYVVGATTGNAVAVPYLSGNNWCFIEAVYSNNNRGKG